MSNTCKYEGILTANPTPRFANGDIDLDTLEKHVERLVATGADGVVPLGGTGEYTGLTFDQRIAVVEHAIKAADGRVPVVPGVLSAGIGDAIQAGQAFVRAGAKALMVVTPYYFRPTQEGIVDYFKKFSDEVDADIILYEIPYRTGVSLTASTVTELADKTRVVAMKACNQDLPTQMRVAESVGKKISILTGEEDVFPLHVAMGAVGGILSSSNVFTRTWAKIYRLARDGDLAQAMALHTALRPGIEAIFSEPNPAPIKAALTMLGLPMGDPITPLLPASDACKERIKKIVLPLYEKDAEISL